jgi:hypothetical protein
MTAMDFGPASVSATTSPSVTGGVLPGLVTRPYAMNARRDAGARKFTLYSAVNTPALAGGQFDDDLPGRYKGQLRADRVMTRWRAKLVQKRSSKPA